MENKTSQRLNYLTYDTGISLRKVAQYTSISYSSLLKYANGERVPTSKNILKLASFYSVSTDFLMGSSTSIYIYTAAGPADKEYNLTSIQKVIGRISIALDEYNSIKETYKISNLVTKKEDGDYYIVRLIKSDPIAMKKKISDTLKEDVISAIKNMSETQFDELYPLVQKIIEKK